MPTNSWVTAHFAAAERFVPGCEGAHLATITSRGEQAVLTDLMADVTDMNAYLGGYQPLFELSLADGWQWITGERWRYTNWADNEPNDEPYGVFIPGSEQNLEAYPGSGDWNDVPEPDQAGAKYFVVEYEDCDFDDDGDDDDDDDGDDDDEEDDDD